MNVRLDGDVGRCGRPGCKGWIGHVREYVIEERDRVHLFVLDGRWLFSDGAWRHDGRTRRTIDPDMTPFHLVMPARVACPVCHSPQDADLPGVDRLPNTEPNTLSSAVGRRAT